MSDEHDFIAFATGSNRTQQATTEDMLSRLPHQLTEGVTATREGLWLMPTWSGVIEMLCGESDEWAIAEDSSVNDAGAVLWVWPDAAERLRYRKGEPWCASGGRRKDAVGEYICGSDHWPELGKEVEALHRLAAILCDGAEEFRVLHWCIHNLCNTRTGTNHSSKNNITPDRGQ